MKYQHFRSHSHSAVNCFPLHCRDAHTALMNELVAPCEKAVPSWAVVVRLQRQECGPTCTPFHRAAQALKTTLSNQQSLTHVRCRRAAHFGGSPPHQMEAFSLRTINQASVPNSPRSPKRYGTGRRLHYAVPNKPLWNTPLSPYGKMQEAGCLTGCRSVPSL